MLLRGVKWVSADSACRFSHLHSQAQVAAYVFGCTIMCYFWQDEGEAYTRVLRRSLLPLAELAPIIGERKRRNFLPQLRFRGGGGGQNATEEPVKPSHLAFFAKTFSCRI